VSGNVPLSWVRFIAAADLELILIRSGTIRSVGWLYDGAGLFGSLEMARER
jgi:hypothetical protein